VVLAIVFTVKATLKNVCNDDDDDDIGRITPGYRARWDGISIPIPIPYPQKILWVFPQDLHTHTEP